MRNIAAIVVVLLVVCAMGCAATSDLTPDQQQYLQSAMATPLDFTMPKVEADEAWKRALDFIQRFSSLRLQQMSEHVIRTYDPTSFSIPFGYYVRRVPLGNADRFTVECMCSTMSLNDETLQNAHILAYYMKTGKLDPMLVNQ